MPGISGTAHDFTETQLEQVLATLDETMYSIERVNSYTYKLIERFTKIIVLRNDLSQPDDFKSATSPVCIGSPVFRNPHLSYVTVARLADGLVHETIHCLLDIAEFKDPFLLESGAISGIRVSSPWSGKSLDLDTYIQACFVWYGLCEFWLLAKESTAFNAEVVTNFMNRSSRGFTSSDIVRPIENLKAVLSPSLPDVLGEAQERVRKAVRA
jgi:hypothetical protein